MEESKLCIGEELDAEGCGEILRECCTGLEVGKPWFIEKGLAMLQEQF